MGWKMRRKRARRDGIPRCQDIIAVIIPIGGSTSGAGRRGGGGGVAFRQRRARARACFLDRRDRDVEMTRARESNPSSRETNTSSVDGADLASAGTILRESDSRIVRIRYRASGELMLLRCTLSGREVTSAAFGGGRGRPTGGEGGRAREGGRENR